MNVGLNFRDQLAGTPPYLVDELDHIIAGIRGAWNIEHTNQDGHAHITAYDLVLTKDDVLGATGNITSTGGKIDMTGTGQSRLGGNLIVAKPGASTDAPVEIGTLLGTASGNDGFIGSGIDINTTERLSAARIRLITAASSFNELRFGWTSGSTVFDVPLQIRDDTTLGGYAVMPGKVTNVIKPCYLGTTTDSSNSGRWTGAFFVDCDAASGYKERSRTVRMGEWTNVTYAAGNFTANAGTWTVQSGDQLIYQYALVGKTMIVNFQLTATSTSAGMSTQLRIAIPGGFTAAKAARTLIYALDSGTAFTGMADVASAGTVINLFRDTTANNWTSSVTNNTGVQGQIVFEVQ